MNFGEVSTAYGQLRRRLSVYAGQDALPNITIDPPKGTSDELSFLRMVAWSYVLLYEAGRVPFGYLRQLPPWNQPASALLPHVRALRTWTSHNLALEKTDDIATLREAIAWFSKTCGAGTPTSSSHWQQCFTALCTDLVGVLSAALGACDAFEKQDDRDRLVDGLKLRLDRNWAAYRFDAVVEEVAIRLGYKGIDPVRVRSLHLDSWRKVVAGSTEDALERNLTLRIEADILAMMGSALPLTSEELAELTGVTKKESVIGMLLSLRAVPLEMRKAVLESLSD
jgi:hypothetical protein